MKIDLNDIRDYTGADDEFIVKLFNKFLEHIRSDIQKLQEATDEKNWIAVKSISHAMLSSARIFSLKELIVLHEKIEKDCLTNSTDNIPPMVTEMSSLYEEVILEMDLLKKSMPAQP